MTHPGPAVPRPTAVRRWVAALAVALLAVGTGWAAVAPREAAARVRASQPLVVLGQDRIARTSPSVHASRIETISARRPLTRVRTVLPVLRRATGRGGVSWVQVRLPGRPNGHKGWIPASQTTPTATAWHISVDLSARRVTVHRDGRAERRFTAVVGTSATPTPRGRFFVEEAVALSSRDAGGPFALATSARSQVLQEFNGGPGQIALHGTNHLTDPLGTASSHGCIRLSERAITWLTRRIAGGVPLTIRQ